MIQLKNSKAPLYIQIVRGKGGIMIEKIGIEPGYLQERPLIPELPKTKKALAKLLEKNIQTIWSGESVTPEGDFYEPGNIGISIVLRLCPHCKHQFKAIERSGCFRHNVEPENCPNCGFPKTVVDKLIELEKKTKK